MCFINNYTGTAGINQDKCRPAYEPAIPFLGVRLRETCTHVHQMTSTGTLRAALFTISPKPETTQTSNNSAMDNTKIVEDGGSSIKSA